MLIEDVEKLGGKVVQTVSLPRTAQAALIVEFNSKQEYENGNLFIVTNGGRVTKRFSPPTPGDSFTNAVIENGILVVNTWNGASMKIDPSSFDLLQNAFVK